MPIRKMVTVVFDEVQLLDVAGPTDALACATRFAPTDNDGYALMAASPDGGPVRTSAGLSLSPDTALAEVEGPIDTLLVPGGPLEQPANAELVSEVARLAGSARRTCAVCTGALLLAEAGLLDGRVATTHWFACPTLAESYPSVTVEPDRIFVNDGPVTTSAGITAGVDLALSLIESDLGTPTARKVARWLVMFLQRPGGQSQFSERLRVEVRSSSPLQSAVDAVVADPRRLHTAAALAERASVSSRHLTRLFADELGMTPGHFVERVRVEAARELLEATPLKLSAVAERSGFGSVETMRRAFLRVTGVGPGEHRRRFSTSRGHPASAAA